MSFKVKFRATTIRFDQKKFAAAADKQMQALFHGAARAFLIATVSRIPVRTGFLRGAFTTLEDAVGNFEFKQAKRLGLAVGKKPRASRARAAKLPPKRAQKLAKRIAKLREIIRKRKASSTAAQLTLDRLTLFYKMRGNVPLNIARTTGGATRGRNLKGGFRLQKGEKIQRIFKQVEYYYPTRNKGSRVLKTPRSGRVFATPAPLIITQQASGVTKTASSGRWVFTYSVNIRYLAINDLRLGWASWARGKLAFQQYIAANFASTFPDAKEFFLQEQVGTRVSQVTGNLGTKR